jgi:HK97 family phage portal protein
VSNLISRAAFIGKLLLSREGRGLLSQGEKALTSNVLQELVAGSAWFQGLPLSKLGDFDSYLKAATKKVWALWTCADLIAEAACSQDHVVRRKRGKVKLELDSSAADYLLEEPNEWQTWRDLKYHTLMQLLVCGNAFWAKDEANNAGQKPKRLVPLNPKRMSIIIDVRNGVIGYVYRPVYAQDRANFSQPIPFEPHEIVHFRKPNPDNDFWGLGAVESGENLFNDFINEDTWRQKFWGRGALPTTLLTLKSGVGGQPTSIPEAKWKQMKANWEQEYGGTENAGKTSWLSGDWAVQRIGLSLAEMQSIEGRKWTVEQIAHQFKVPLSVLGLDSAANYATASIDRRRFLEFAVLPTLKNFEQRVNKDLIRGFDETLTLEHDVSGLVSLDELAGPLQTLISNSVITPNEARQVIGKEKVDDPAMDRHYMTSGLTPIELNGVADLGGVDAAAQQLQQRVTGRQIGKPRKPVVPGLEDEEE